MSILTGYLEDTYIANDHTNRILTLPMSILTGYLENNYTANEHTHRTLGGY